MFPRAVRTSDADREATVQHVQQAFARGLLTFEEAGERMTAAYAAQFSTQLADLTADLPSAPDTPDAARSWAAAPRQTPVRPGTGQGGRSPRYPILLALLTMLVVTVAVMVGLVLLALGGIGLHDLLHIANP